MRKILVIGAGGGVAGVLVKRLKAAAEDVLFTLADINPDRVPPELLDGRAAAAPLDLFDSNALGKMVSGHDIVLNCAGPFMRTAEPVARACIAHKKPYLDLCDDNEALDALLPLDAEARAAGVTLVMGAGVSPGFTNVFAADLKRRFEKIDVMDVAWLSGDEGGEAQGRAVLEHVLHIAGGRGARWRHGALEEFESYTIPSRFPMGGGMGDRTLFEVAHPEPMMLGRTFPDIPLIRCFGGIDPPAVGAVVRGIARAVHGKRLSTDQAVRFMQAASSGQLAAPGAWLPAISGIARGLGSGMIGAGDVLSFAGFMAGRHQTFAGGILCRITGISEGRKRTLVMRSRNSGPGTFVDSMPNATGTCGAAFSLLLLDGAWNPGIRFVEETDPENVYNALKKLGVSTDEMIEGVFEVATS